MRPFTQKLVMLFFVIMLVMPGLSILLPVETNEIENERVVAPEFEASRVADLGLYRDAVRYVLDANIMREWLITAVTMLEYRVFGDSPNPTAVLIGRDGWMYARDVNGTMCGGSPALVTRNLLSLVDLMERRGARVIFTVVPAKVVVHPDNLEPEQSELLACMRAASVSVRDLLRDEARRGYVDSWALFQRLAEDGEELYFRTDTHFNSSGSIPWIKAMIDEIDPLIWDESAVLDRGAIGFSGNLGILVGPGIIEEVSQVVVDRGLPRSPVERLHAPLSPSMHSTERYVTHAPDVIPGTTIWLKDSFGDIPRTSMAQYFEDLTVMDWRSEDSVRYFMSRAGDADTIIIEIDDDGLFFRLDEDALMTVLVDEGVRQ